MSIPLSQRLKTETAHQHDRMEALMAHADPFSGRENFARFVAALYLYQRDVEHLFADPLVQAAVPDLTGRGRQAAARADLVDLGVPVPDDRLATAAVRMPEALGWVYVSEGSTLGAALLLKEAQEKLGLSEGFGARSLAAYPGGRAQAWKRFVEALDAPALAGMHDQIIAGANAGYDRFGELLARFFPQPERADA